VVGGFVAMNDDERAERLGFLQNAVGAVPSPFDCYLALRGVKTLALRMERHCANARVIAERLAEHDAVTEVLWPGLASHADHEVARRQMRDFGGMVSFRCAGGEAAALEVARSTRLFTLAESLGAVESLIEHPARMTHASVTGTTLEVPSDLLRLSVGIEGVEDLWRDVDQAMTIR
jgi:cystathionine gamma-synthase